MNCISTCLGKRAAITVAMFIALWGCAWHAVSADQDNTSDASSKTLVIDLKLNVSTRSFGSFYQSTEKTTFKKIPDNSSKDTRSFFLIQGTNKTGIFLDRSNKLLYVDLNNNSDLTDDRDGVFKTAFPPGNMLQFTDVAFDLLTPQGLIKSKADFLFYPLQDNPNIQLKSYFQGRLQHNNKDLQVGLVFAPSFRTPLMLLRPYSEKEQPFSMYTGIPELFDIEKQIFLDGTLYQYEINSGNDFAKGIQLVLKPLPSPTLCEVKLKGKYLRRLVLRKNVGTPMTVILDNPPETVLLPEGQYFCPLQAAQNAWLHNGTNNACSLQSVSLTVNDKQVNEFWVGGPVTNTVTYARRGSSLVFNYALKGAGGRVYSVPNPDRSNPPSFTVYKGDRKVFSGKFEYG